METTVKLATTRYNQVTIIRIIRLFKSFLSQPLIKHQFRLKPASDEPISYLNHMLWKFAYYYTETPWLAIRQIRDFGYWEQDF